MSSMSQERLVQLLEAAMMAYGKPMSLDKMLQLFDEDKQPSTAELKAALAVLEQQCADRGVELKEVASGYRYQSKQEYAEWISRLWEEKAPRYSRALLETLALVAYRQPVTRSEIEDVRGVSVSSHIVKTLLERDWIRVVGHRDVPGRPALYATTKEFLDYFNLKKLEDLPSLSEIRDLDNINVELDLEQTGDASDESQISTTVNQTSNENASDVERAIDSDGDSDTANKNVEVELERADPSVLEDTEEFEETVVSEEREVSQEIIAEYESSKATDAEILEDLEFEKAESNIGDQAFNDAIEPEELDEPSETSVTDESKI